MAIVNTAAQGEALLAVERFLAHMFQFQIETGRVVVSSPSSRQLR
jgi:hypothetical protein